MREDAVSPVIGETLMILLVLILVPFVTISLMNQLPEERVPTVTIRMGPLIGDTVTFYHKGGDWIKKSEIKIAQMGDTKSFNYIKPVFDLGDTITAHNVNPDIRIDFIAKNSVIFSGVPKP